MNQSQRKQITGEQLLQYALAFPRLARGHGSRREKPHKDAHFNDTRRRCLCVHETCRKRISEDHTQSPHHVAKQWCEDQGYEVPAF